jgi:hypothetical protein
MINPYPKFPLTKSTLDALISLKNSLINNNEKWTDMPEPTKALIQLALTDTANTSVKWLDLLGGRRLVKRGDEEYSLSSPRRTYEKPPHLKKATLDDQSFAAAIQTQKLLVSLAPKNPSPGRTLNEHRAQLEAGIVCSPSSYKLNENILTVTLNLTKGVQTLEHFDWHEETNLGLADNCTAAEARAYLAAKYTPMGAIKKQHASRIAIATRVPFQYRIKWSAKEDQRSYCLEERKDRLNSINMVYATWPNAEDYPLTLGDNLKYRRAIRNTLTSMLRAIKKNQVLLITPPEEKSATYRTMFLETTQEVMREEIHLYHNKHIIIQGFQTPHEREPFLISTNLHAAEENSDALLNVEKLRKKGLDPVLMLPGDAYKYPGYYHRSSQAELCNREAELYTRLAPMIMPTHNPFVNPAIFSQLTLIENEEREITSGMTDIAIIQKLFEAFGAERHLAGLSFTSSGNPSAKRKNFIQLYINEGEEEEKVGKAIDMLNRLLKDELKIEDSNFICTFDETEKRWEITLNQITLECISEHIATRSPIIRVSTLFFTRAAKDETAGVSGKFSMGAGGQEA